MGVGKMAKSQTLKVKKLLKAIRRRNKMVKSHNFETKTLNPVTPIIGKATQRLLDIRTKEFRHNKEMRIERGK